MTLFVTEDRESCTFRVRVAPGSRREEVVGLYGDALKIRLTAAPEKGKANRALQEFLAERLGVAPSAVEILSGHTSHLKHVRVKGVTAAAVRALL